MPQDNEPEKKRRQCTQIEFFKLCEMLRNKQEQILKECRKYKDVRKLAEQEIGVEFSDYSINQALIAVNMTLPQQGKSGGSVNKIVVATISELFERLGEEPPTAFLELLDSWHMPRPKIAPPKPVQQPKDTGTPVRTLIDPKTIPVVTPHHRPNDGR